MNHAISNYGSLEAGYYRRQTADHIADLRLERVRFAAEQIMDAFDWQDVRDALELAWEKSPEAAEALCEAMSHLAHMNIGKIEDRQLRAIAEAFSKIGHNYADHRAMREAA
jgi:hypothetical protein